MIKQFAFLCALTACGKDGGSSYQKPSEEFLGVEALKISKEIPRVNLRDPDIGNEASSESQKEIVRKSFEFSTEQEETAKIYSYDVDGSDCVDDEKAAELELGSVLTVRFYLKSEALDDPSVLGEEIKESRAQFIATIPDGGTYHLMMEILNPGQCIIDARFAVSLEDEVETLRPFLQNFN